MGDQVNMLEKVTAGSVPRWTGSLSEAAGAPLHFSFKVAARFPDWYSAPMITLQHKSWEGNEKSTNPTPSVHRSGNWDSEGAIFVKSSFLDDEIILNSKCFWLSD